MKEKVLLKYYFFGNDYPENLWRKPSTAIQFQNLLPTVKHPVGFFRFAFIAGMMDRHQDQSLLGTFET